MDSPEFIDPTTWSDWCDMRREKKYPCTDRVWRAAIRTLRRLDEEGHDPNAVLNNAIQGEWQGLFPGDNTQRKKTRAEYVPAAPTVARTNDEKAALRSRMRLVKGAVK